MNKKAIITAIAFYLMLPIASYPNMDKYVPNEKAWALQFSINQNFNLGSFNGATISLLKHSSLNKAWRYGITIGAGVNDLEFETNQGSGTTLVTDQNVYNYNISLDLIKITYPNTASKINLFYGLGPLVQMNYRKDKSETNPVNSYNSTREISQASWKFGAKLIVGTQWMFSKSLAIHAEYGSEFNYTYTKNKTKTIRELDTSDDIRTDERVTKGIQFGSANVRFGLTVYF